MNILNYSQTQYNWARGNSSNKLFEYIFSGLPVIVSDFPEMGKLIEEFQCGWKVAVDEGAVMSLISSLTPEQITEKGNNISKVQMTYSWEIEKEKLFNLYRNIISEASA